MPSLVYCKYCEIFWPITRPGANVEKTYCPKNGGGCKKNGRTNPPPQDFSVAYPEEGVEKLIV